MVGKLLRGKSGVLAKLTQYNSYRRPAVVIKHHLEMAKDEEFDQLWKGIRYVESEFLVKLT